jgi:hypothetical protein
MPLIKTATTTRTMQPFRKAGLSRGRPALQVSGQSTWEALPRAGEIWTALPKQAQRAQREPA